MTIGDEESAYRLGAPPEVEKILDKLTVNRNWDYPQFRKLLIALGTIGNGQSIPARNRPDSIHVQGLRPDIDELSNATIADGRERSRVIFVDIERQSLVVSGKTSIGSGTGVRVISTPEPGREQFQRRVSCIHTHPLQEKGHHEGFSDDDYSPFLQSPLRQSMFITYGKTVLMVLKTSVTPNNLSLEAIKKRLGDALEDYYLNPSDLSSSAGQRVVRLNKAICTEFGLVLYKADENNRDLMERVAVTK